EDDIGNDTVPLSLPAAKGTTDNDQRPQSHPTDEDDIGNDTVPLSLPAAKGTTDNDQRPQSHPTDEDDIGNDTVPLSPPPAAEPITARSPSGTRLWLPILVVLLAALWGATAVALVSSPLGRQDTPAATTPSSAPASPSDPPSNGP
ncbi:hypothetical protein, partial [Actinoplanes regularis]|uniref:hypothetical protein n=1 Tax=Actinoplanes regularis TaxID=52697 RepID=UPI003D7F579D